MGKEAGSAGEQVVADSETQDFSSQVRENEDYRRQVEDAEASQANKAWFDPSDVEKRLAGQLGALTGLLAGVPRGAYHLVQDGLGAASFAGRLMDPYDAESSPPNQSAWDDVLRTSQATINNLGRYISHPAQISGDLSRLGVGSNVHLRPLPTPLAPTAGGEFGRGMQTGMNVGEGVFNTLALIGGAAELKSIPELRALSPGAATADYLPAGVPQALADYMATPYSGMGSHAPLPRRTKLPGGAALPTALLDSPFNRFMPPEGTPRGAFYRYHYAIDPFYHGGPVQRAFGGGGWSGAKLGWTKYGPLARAWYGTPSQTKAAGILGLASAGWPVPQFCPAGGGQ